MVSGAQALFPRLTICDLPQFIPLQDGAMVNINLVKLSVWREI